MMPLFADTSFYLALLNKHDRWHLSASQLFASIDSTIVTTDYVLLELGALMSRRNTRPIFIRFVKEIRSDPYTRLVHSSIELMECGLSLFASRLDKEWSLTDCISFELMKREGMQCALTSDRHFEQAGFQCLLQEQDRY